MSGSTKSRTHYVGARLTGWLSWNISSGSWFCSAPYSWPVNSAGYEPVWSFFRSRVDLRIQIFFFPIRTLTALWYFRNRCLNWPLLYRQWWDVTSTKNRVRATKIEERGTRNGKLRAGNGEWGTENEERRTENEEQRTRNGERGTENEERRMRNGEWGTENEERRMRNGQRGTRNGERGTGNGKRETGNGKRRTGSKKRKWGTKNGETGVWDRNYTLIRWWPWVRKGLSTRFEQTLLELGRYSHQHGWKMNFFFNDFYFKRLLQIHSSLSVIVIA